MDISKTLGNGFTYPTRHRLRARAIHHHHAFIRDDDSIAEGGGDTRRIIAVKIYETAGFYLPETIGPVKLLGRQASCLKIKRVDRPIFHFTTGPGGSYVRKEPG